MRLKPIIKRVRFQGAVLELQSMFPAVVTYHKEGHTRNMYRTIYKDQQGRTWAYLNGKYSPAQHLKKNRYELMLGITAIDVRKA